MIMINSGVCSRVFISITTYRAVLIVSYISVGISLFSRSYLSAIVRAGYPDHVDGCGWCADGQDMWGGQQRDQKSDRRPCTYHLVKALQAVTEMDLFRTDLQTLSSDQCHPGTPRQFFLSGISVFIFCLEEKFDLYWQSIG